MSAIPVLANLSQLPDDLLVAVAKRLQRLDEFVCFRCVSKSLFAAAKDDYFEGPRLRKGMPYLMLPVRDDGDEHVRELYSLVKGESIVASINIPDLKTKKCFESLGWLLVVDKDGSMSLLDPFSVTGARIPVPHQSTYPGDMEELAEYVFIQKMVLSARPSETSDFVLMVICSGSGSLAYWRPGDEAWNKIDTRKGRYADVVYDGATKLFYAIGFGGFVWAFNLDDYGDKVEGRVIVSCRRVIPRYRSVNLYLLKIDDALLIITRAAPEMSKGNLCFITDEFDVYEVDIEGGKYEEIDSLGNMAVFLGENSSIAVDASKFPGVIKPNHIYFTDDAWEYYYFNSPKGGGMDIGIYSVEEDTVESIYIPESRCSAEYLHPYGSPRPLRRLL